jgi:hypothetical protein
MDGIPTLSEHDLRAHLERAYDRGRKHHLFAVYGTGQATQIVVGSRADVQVIPVRSELELREKLPPLDEDPSPRVYLVPWTHDLPLDIAGRFALRGRVQRIGKHARLQHLFGTPHVPDEATQTALTDYLLRPGQTERYPVGDSALTEPAMWAAWLKKDWGLDIDGGIALDSVLGWAATDRRGPSFLEAMRAPAASGVREGLMKQLEALGTGAGAAAQIAWRAWEQSQGEAVVQLAVLFEVLAANPRPEVRMWIKHRVREDFGWEDEDALLLIAEALGRAAAGALRMIERRTEPGVARQIAKNADDRVRDSEVREALRASARLPSAWLQRLEHLGEVLAAGAAAPSIDAVELARTALADVERHDFGKDPSQSRILKRAELAVRLLAWLVTRPEATLEPSVTPYGDAETLGRWYVAEGGFVDWARRGARGSTDGAFGKGIEAVLQAADAVRTDLDRRFARSLLGWVEAGQPSQRVIPIHDAVRRIATRFLDGNPSRRLLILLMDGMAWSQAVEILGSLGQREWAPLAWHATKEGKVGESIYPVVFAGFPTVTEVSRSSFFAGKAFKPGERLDTLKDADRWKDNPHVKKYAEGSDVPRLLLRSEARTGSGGASQEALSLVASPERRVVGIVLNAIDDQLKASEEVAIDWTVDRIKSLPDLLDKARECGRAVLLASDHGHVPSDRLVRKPGATSGGGARWRPWPSADAPLKENEIGVTGGSVYVPKGAHGIVMLTDDATTYAGNTHSGEHGGATLAEVVAPCLFIGAHENARGPFAQDPAQDIRAAHVPAWWNFDLREPADVMAAEEAATSIEPPVVLPPPDASGPQLLLPVDPVPAPPAVRVAVSEVPPSRFASSEVLAAQVPVPAERGRVVTAVELLLARHGVVSADAFAAALRLLPFRVEGYITTIQEKLNLDGYQVLRFDREARQIHLDREKLCQLFEVEL